MADTKATVASGADPAGEAARRRNVPGSTVPVDPAQQFHADEKKVHGKKVCHAIRYAQYTDLLQICYGFAILIELPELLS